MRYDYATRFDVVKALNHLTANTVPHPDDVDAAVELLNHILSNGQLLDEQGNA